MSDDDLAPLASLSLTHVYYDPNDPVSYLCAYLALVPQALCIVYATLIWSNREAEVALMFAGQLACEAVNLVLKRLIKEERPSRIHRTGKGYGMPSSHAQFVAFWAVAVTLFLLVRHAPSWTGHGYRQRAAAGNGAAAAAAEGPREGARDRRGRGRGPGGAGWGQEWVRVESYAHRPWSFVERAMASVLVLGVAALVAWSRVYLGYHTVKQVLVGSLAGTLSAVAWFVITAVVRKIGLLSWAIETPIARAMRVRDLVVSEDLSQSGWEKWEKLEDKKWEDRKAAAEQVKKNK